MLFPVYIHKDEGSAYGISFPDFPGCFSAADDLAAIPHQAQDAVALYFEGESMVIPQPSTPEHWRDDERFQGGYWMLLELDPAPSASRPVRLDVTLPESLVRAMDAYVATHRQSRSVFLAHAAEQAMRDSSATH